MDTYTNVIVTVKHDNGKVKIKVWASSLDDAKNKVMRAENCPLSAIIKTQTEKPSIYDIKRLTADTSPYFFSSKTMRFFKQTMRDFSVTRWDDIKFLVCAPSFGGNTTKRLFNPFTNELEHTN